MDGLDAGMTLITVVITEVESNGDAGIQRGDTGTLQVTAEVGSLSDVPLISVFLPNQLSSTVEFRLEQDPDQWAPATIAMASCP
jgi:hypothetical protein